ncbi:MAG: hypothetical protein [Wendovervirus sonii]|uniref:Uncharacterized protein n=1 Tax=phage Lak_Megaphage_Sonny TaxID=3109229 RepID=A0ABZ0Z2P5_9CAUD|nr:MAG: hypothetical protein [phage Lak_Megaphage_Sonny]
MKNISKYIEYDEILYEKSFHLNIGNMSFEVCRITDYDRAFINAAFSPEMLQDYFKHSYKCSHLQLSPGYNNVTRYKIFTDYDEILDKLNEKEYKDLIEYINTYNAYWCSIGDYTTHARDRC